ncbi:hypothetical protein H239_2589 [Klebsiella pneumoniae UHKPC45]|nr:hypothetical protein H239_2589 [Klebsiella pneumoniae UHKPC45]
MCHAGDGERAVIVVLYTNDAVLLRHQVSIFDDPDALRLWCLTVCRCNRHLPTTVYRLNGPCLRNTRWQVQMQAVALFCIDITIKRDYASIHRADTTTINSPGQPFVAQPNDVTWLRDPAVQPDINFDHAVLIVGQDPPQPFTMGFTLPRTTNGRDFQLVKTVSGNQFRDKCGLHRIGIGVIRIRPGNQRVGVAGLTGAAGISRATKNIRARIVEIDITRHIGLNDNLLTTPAGHPPENSSEIAQYGVGVVTLLNIDIADITRLHAIAAPAIGNQLITILRNRVERPFGDIRAGQTIAKTETIRDNNVVINPCRVISPCPFEAPCPCAGIFARFRVVVIRDTDNTPTRLAGDLRDGTIELAGVEFDVQQRGVWVTQLRVNNLGVALQRHYVADFHAVRVRRYLAKTQRPGAACLR